MSGTISATLTANYTLTANSTTILPNGAVITAVFAGVPTSVSNGAAVYGPAGAARSLTNSGTIAGGRYGVELASGGVINNLATASLAANYSGAKAILDRGTPATISNAGRIRAIGGGATDAALYAGGTVTNAAGGSIYATGGRAVGILIGAGTSATTAAISNAGVIYATGGAAKAIALYTGGTINNLSGGYIDATGGAATGILITAGGTINNAAGATIGRQNYFGIVIGGGAATIVNSGIISWITASPTLSSPLGPPSAAAAGTIVNAGTIGQIQLPNGFANRVIADPGAVFSGTLNGGGTLSTFELASGAATGTITGLGSQVGNFGTVHFDTGANWLASVNTAALPAEIEGFAQGDTILLAGVTATGSSFSGGTLTVQEASGTVTLRLEEDFDPARLMVTNVAAGADVTLTPCFAAGTRIATPHGAVAVERLQVGDRVITISGKLQPVQWIGWRTVDCRRHATPERVKPIRIAAHAFGHGRPSRSLFLSPDHAVFVEDVLIPVKFLLNATTVRQVDVVTVRYYHIELPRHDIVSAEGLPTETYLETGGRSAFENGGGPIQIHPDFAPDESRVGMVWRSFGYAPLLGSEGQLDRVRALLACQARILATQARSPTRRPRRQRASG